MQKPQNKKHKTKSSKFLPSARGTMMRGFLVLSMLLPTQKGQADQNHAATPTPHAQAEHLSESDKQSYQELYAQMPAGIRAFEKMDFDARQVQEEYLCLKAHKNLFMDVIRFDMLKTDPSPINPAVLMALEIADLGRAAMSIRPESPIRETAKSCGLNRVCDLVDFKRDKANRGRHFLDGKDDFYQGGLKAELGALDGISYLFPLEDWLSLKREFMAEIWHYSKAHPNSSGGNLYYQTIHKRALQKQQMEQVLFAAHDRK